MLAMTRRADIAMGLRMLFNSIFGTMAVCAGLHASRLSRGSLIESLAAGYLG